MKFYTKINKKNTFATSLMVFSAFSIFLPIRTAQAGLFSFISTALSGEASAQTIDTTYTTNSQNMMLLTAAVNIDPTSHHLEDSTLLAYDNALVAEIGPQGTISEIGEEINTDISIYTVREGDNLGTIAELYGVSVNTIKWANEIRGPIKAGQTLVILPTSGTKYIVKRGDTIRGITLRHGADLGEVLAYNDMTVNTPLIVGKTLIIPDVEPLASDIPKIATTRSGSTKATFPPGYFIRPIVGGRLSQGIHGKNGVDLAAPAGTIVRASAGGTVVSSISNGLHNGGYGNYSLISHIVNGKTVYTLYAHLQKSIIKAGDTVKQGQMIGYVGNTGKSTGNHLHFEVRDALGRTNPITY